MTSRRKRRLVQRRQRLCAELGRLSNLIRGSFVRSRKKCGRPGCACEKGVLHPHVVISTHREGHTEIVYVPKASEARAEDAVGAYKRARQIIEELSGINVELFKAREL